MTKVMKVDSYNQFFDGTNNIRCYSIDGHLLQ